MENFQSLGMQIRSSDDADAGDVCTRPVETGHEPGFDRVDTDNKDDGDRRSRGFGCVGRNAINDNHRYLSPNQIGRQSRQTMNIAPRPAVFDRQVLTFDVACFFQALAECSQKMFSTFRGCAPEKSDDRHGLLRACRNRPRGRAAEQRNEIAPFHCPVPSRAERKE